MNATPTVSDTESIQIAVQNAVVQAEHGGIIPLMPGGIVNPDGLVCGARWTEQHGLLELREVLYRELGSKSIRGGEAEELATRYNCQRREFKSPSNPNVSIYLSLVLPIDSPDYQPYVKFEIGPAGGLNQD